MNYANGDMVGHTGQFDAAVTAVEILDECIGRIEQALLAQGGEGLITADHGNCEQMRDYENNQPHTQHTTEPVPLIYLGGKQRQLDANGGILADVAPTILALMDIDAFRRHVRAQPTDFLIVDGRTVQTPSHPAVTFHRDHSVDAGRLCDSRYR